MKKQNNKNNPELQPFYFLLNRTKPFDVESLFANIGHILSTENKEGLRKILCHNLDFVEENGLYHPKASFLSDVPICIQPTQLELDKGILIPGHRLLPFYPPMELFDISFETADDHQKIESQSIFIKFNEVLIYFSLMDIQTIPIKNLQDLLGAPNDDLEISVCQLKEFYKKHHFKWGDKLIVRPLDLCKGQFSIEYEADADFQARFFETERLDRTFIHALREVINNYPLHFSTDKQLLQTYFNLKKNPHYTWTMPGSPLGTLLQQNPDVIFSTLPNGRTIFHFADQPLENLQVYSHFKKKPTLNIDEVDLNSIDDILQFVFNPNNKTIVRALIIDMLTSQEEFNYTKIEEYLFSESPKPYLPEPLEQPFRTLVEKEYKAIKKKFKLQYAYLPVTVVRQKILANNLLICQYLLFIDASAVPVENFPQSDYIQIMDILKGFSQILHGLDKTQLGGDYELTGIQTIDKMVDSIASKLPIIFATINRKLGL